MRGCLAGADCEPKEKTSPFLNNQQQLQLQQHQQSAARYNLIKDKKCGLDFAYAYFCSFIFLSTFLVCFSCIL